MKKLISILVIFSLLFLCGCNLEKPESFSDLKAVAEYAITYYTENKPADSSHLTLDLGNTQWQTVQIEELTKNIKKFSYIWVEESYTVFWNDETKTYGVLYAPSPFKAIKSLRSWYTSLKIKRIEKSWYEIGQLYAR